MRIRHLWGGVVPAVLAGAVIAGCGGSSSGSSSASVPSGLDPANMAPADAVLYASVTVRPQGQLRTDFDAVVRELAGPSALRNLGATLTRELNKGNKNSSTRIGNWFGQRIGVVITRIPAGGLGAVSSGNDVALVIPTNNPNAAKQFLAAHPSTGTVQKVVGHYVVAGDAATVAAVTATTQADSLAASAVYKAATAHLGSAQIAFMYGRIKPLVQVLLTQTRGLQDATVASAQMNTLSAQLKALPSSATFAAALNLSSHTIAFSAYAQGVPHNSGAGTTVASAPSDVSGLPGDSWLALAVGGQLANAKEIEKLSTNVAPLLGESSVLSQGSSARSVIAFVQRDLLPALGPLSVSIAGTSTDSIHAGVEITPDNAAAGARLRTATAQLLNGLPLKVEQAGKKVVVAFGYASVLDLLTPSSTLADNATYKQALAQLPSNSSVPFFLNFGPLEAFKALDKSPSDAKVWQVIAKLNYLIAGGSGDDFRIVLGVR
jgi:hypothetical protein